MQISKEEIKHIANLASLNLSDQEVENYTKDMDNILQFANTINNLDTEKIEETIGINESSNVFRKDEIKEFKDKDLLLQNAPEQENRMFKIPKVIN